MTDSILPITRGQTWRDMYGDAKVLGMVEGYVVARRKGAHPMIFVERSFRKRFTLVKEKS